MDKEIIKAMKEELKLQEKIIKTIKRIDKLPDAARKILETKNIIGPRDDEKLAGMIKEFEQLKKQVETDIEK